MLDVMTEDDEYKTTSKFLRVLSNLPPFKSVQISSNMHVFSIVLCACSIASTLLAHPIPLLEKISEPIFQFADKPSTALLFIGVPGALTAWITAKSVETNSKKTAAADGAEQMVAAIKEKEAVSSTNAATTP